MEDAQFSRAIRDSFFVPKLYHNKEIKRDEDKKK
jgi:hypothetical protein